MVFILIIPFSEPGANRVFPYQNILQNNNSATNCLTLCSTFGYPAAGMEFGDECCMSFSLLVTVTVLSLLKGAVTSRTLLTTEVRTLQRQIVQRPARAILFIFAEALSV